MAIMNFNIDTDDVPEVTVTDDTTPFACLYLDANKPSPIGIMFPGYAHDNLAMMEKLRDALNIGIEELRGMLERRERTPSENRMELAGPPMQISEATVEPEDLRVVGAPKGEDASLGGPKPAREDAAGEENGGESDPL